MKQATRTVLLWGHIALTTFLICLVCWTLHDIPQASRPTGSFPEPDLSRPQTKIDLDMGEFLKIGQSNGLTFTLSESRTVSQKEMQCLAKNIYHEARGEGIAGMMGVAQVTLNRADSQHRGKDTLCSVVNDPNQFSWTKKKPKRLDKMAWQQALHVAQLVLMGVRIEGLEEATHFHSMKSNPPHWSKKSSVNKTIGRHVYSGGVNG